MDTQVLIALISLIALEVVLGIDNIIFITILANKLPINQQAKVRYIGIGLAMFMRLGLLALISWIMKLDQTLFTIIDQKITGKELILILGGIFLLYKSAKEIYHKVEAKEENNLTKGATSFGSVLIQVLLLDLVFSIDSIITAVGMVDELWVMYTAVVITVLIMLIAAKPIADFVNKHPAFKVLALSFLMMIGMALLAEGFEIHIPKGYIYFSMAFALLVDIIQMKTNVAANTANK